MKKFSLSFLLGALAVLLAIPPLYSDQRRQVIQDNTLSDMDYGFQLSRPTETWGFLREKTIRRFDAQALAGLYHAPAETYTLVALEQGEGELKYYLQELVEELGLKRGRVRQSEIEAGAGGSVGHLRLDGYKDGQQRSYLVTVFPGRNSFYRVVSWWPGNQESRVAADIKRIHKDFKIIGGAEIVPKTTPDPYEMIGVGWEARNNFYQNSILGVSASLPRADWRFLGRQELRDLNPEAAMGMEHVDGAYLVLVAEKLGAYVWQGYEATVIESLKSEIKFAAHETRPVRLMDQKRTLHIFREVEVPGGDGKIDYGVIVSTAETYGYQWFAWWPSGESEKALAALDAAYSQFTYMDWTRQKELRGKLLGFAHRPRSVRHHENFRNLTYRNYATGTILKLPRDFWEHRLDEEPPRVAGAEPQPSVHFENVTNGLYITLRHEECKFRPAAYHKEVIKSLGEHEVLYDHVYGGPFGPVFATRLRPEEDKDFIYHIATAVRRGTCLQLSMHGYERNLKDSLGLERRVLRGLSMSGRNFPDEKDAYGQFIDYRMGYALRKPRGWDFRHIKVAGEGESSLLTAEKEGLAVLVGGVQSNVEPRELPADFSELEFLKDVVFEDPELTAVQWLGQTSQRLIFRGKRGETPISAEVLITGIGGSNFFILAVGDADETQIPDALREGFRLLD